MSGHGKAGVRDGLPILLSDSMHGLMVCPVLIVWPLPNLEHVSLGGWQDLLGKCPRDSFCVLLLPAATELSPCHGGVLGHKLAGGSHIMHVGDASPGQTNIHMNTLRMFDFGGVLLLPFLCHMYKPHGSACVLEHELLSICNHNIAPMPLTVALTEGTLDVHAGLSDCWRGAPRLAWSG